MSRDSPLVCPVGRADVDWTVEPKYTEQEKKDAASAGHPVPADTYIVGITIEAEFKNGKLSYFYICRLEST